MGDSEEKELISSARAGNLELVEILIQEGLDVNEKDGENSTALHWGAWGGHTAVLTVLLKAGADPHAVNKLQASALHWASWGGHTEAAKVLLEGGALCDSVDTQDGTPLHYAAKKGHSDLANHLISAGAPINKPNRTAATPLHLASFHNRIELVQTLLIEGADPLLVDDSGSSPLHVACKRCNLEVLKLLLKFHADPAAPDGNGATPNTLVGVSATVAHTTATEDVLRLLCEAQGMEYIPAPPPSNIPTTPLQSPAFKKSMSSLNANSLSPTTRRYGSPGSRHSSPPTPSSATLKAHPRANSNTSSMIVNTSAQGSLASSPVHSGVGGVHSRSVSPKGYLSSSAHVHSQRNHTYMGGYISTSMHNSHTNMASTPLGDMVSTSTHGLNSNSGTPSRPVSLRRSSIGISVAGLQDGERTPRTSRGGSRTPSHAVHTEEGGEGALTQLRAQVARVESNQKASEDMLHDVLMRTALLEREVTKMKGKENANPSHVLRHTASAQALSRFSAGESSVSDLGEVRTFVAEQSASIKQIKDQFHDLETEFELQRKASKILRGRLDDKELLIQELSNRVSQIESAAKEKPPENNGCRCSIM